MLRRNWRYVLAVIGLAGATAGSGVWVYYLDNPVSGQARPREQDQPAKEVAAPAERIARSLEAIEKGENSDQNEERARRDLDAQEGAWRWTKWAAWVAGVQAILSAAGIAFVVLSLKQGQAGLMAARRAIRHARTANEITERVQRPWVGISFEPVFVGCRDEIFVVEVVAKFQNLGATPAASMSAHIELFFTDKSYKDGIQGRFEEISRLRIETSSAILPNETIERRLTFTEEVEKLTFFGDDEKRGIFLTVIASVHYRAASGAPEGWLETSRVVLLQRRVLTKGRFDAGHLLSAFPSGSFSYPAAELAVEPLGFERAT